MAKNKKHQGKRLQAPSKVFYFSVQIRSISENAPSWPWRTITNGLEKLLLIFSVYPNYNHTFNILWAIFMLNK